jgi:hypothetical protein
MNYRKLVLDHYEAEIDETYELTPSYDVQFCEVVTADGYTIYRRFDGDRSVAWDVDIFYYPENMADEVIQCIKDGMTMFVDEEIISVIGADHEESYFWEELYNEFKETEHEDN